MTSCEYYTYSFENISSAASLLPPRTPRSNKRDYGRLLCVCGSSGMAGAAYLCALAAYRSGAGLVEIFTHEDNRTALQTLLPEAVLTCYTEYSPALLRERVETADAIVAGCGLGRTAEARSKISDLVRLAGEGRKPLVLDADALNIISESRVLMKYAKSSVITPHAGEMSRLTGRSIPEILSDVAETAESFAKTYGLVCVLKDHRTAVADGSGRVYLNTTGNSGMATGGSGDVLAGIIGGLMAQKRCTDPSSLADIAALAVYIHGLCGDLAAEELTEYSVMASDLINALPKALKNFFSGN